MRGFTLVEIMIVVAIIALLAALALPSFLRARKRTRKTRYVNALRVARDACDLYATEHNAYPPDAQPGALPAGMDNYFGGKFDWTAPTPIGARWDWDKGVLGIKAGVSVDQPAESLIDDGNLTTGAYREVADGIYSWIIE